jgi:hypothetical protein
MSSRASNVVRAGAATFGSRGGHGAFVARLVPLSRNPVLSSCGVLSGIFIGNFSRRRTTDSGRASPSRLGPLSGIAAPGSSPETMQLVIRSRSEVSHSRVPLAPKQTGRRSRWIQSSVVLNNNASRPPDPRSRLRMSWSSAQNKDVTNRCPHSFPFRNCQLLRFCSVIRR